VCGLPEGRLPGVPLLPGQAQIRGSGQVSCKVTAFVDEGRLSGVPLLPGQAQIRGSGQVSFKVTAFVDEG
jgi:hypothetical protein